MHRLVSNTLMMSLCALRYKIWQTLGTAPHYLLQTWPSFQLCSTSLPWRPSPVLSPFLRRGPLGATSSLPLAKLHSHTTRDAVDPVRLLFLLTTDTVLNYAPTSFAACGKTANGYTAAINQLAFGSADQLGPGDACGRCFAITGNKDPYSPNYTGPFGQTIVVKVTDLCPAPANPLWCGQTTSNPTNTYKMPFQCVYHSGDLG